MIVDKGWTIAGGALGNHVKIILPIRTVLYKFLQKEYRLLQISSVSLVLKQLFSFAQCELHGSYGRENKQIVETAFDKDARGYPWCHVMPATHARIWKDIQEATDAACENLLHYTIARNGSRKIRIPESNSSWRFWCAPCLLTE